MSAFYVYWLGTRGGLCTRGSTTRVLRYLAVAAFAFSISPGSLAACSLGKLAELPITMQGRRALVPAKLNGIDANLLVDSGSFYSMLSPASAAAYKLKVHPTTALSLTEGLNGYVSVGVTTVQSFLLANIPLGRDFQFLVGGTDVGGDAAGLLGQNILGIADTEYDLSKGIINLMKPSDCADKPLAYWATSAGVPFGVIPIEDTGRHSWWLLGTASLNGVKIRVQFDTGSSQSFLTLAAAKRAGITPNSPGVTPAGEVTGLGQGSVRSWIGPFTSFAIGGEETHNTRLRFNDTTLKDDVDMWIGMDWFLSHHVYVANSQHKLYFTYNGGPVFDVEPVHNADIDTLSTTSLQLGGNDSDPKTAQDFSRRGSASASRLDFAHAIADLTRACELDPAQPTYFYQRAMAYLGAGHPELALPDLDQALTLKADYVDALLVRANLHSLQKDTRAARADLDTVDRSLPKESALRQAVGMAYLRAASPAQATEQLDLWIAAHPHDAALAVVLNDRCWTRVLWNQQLEQAEADCRAALRLRLRPDNASFLDSRGWLEYRRGQFDKSLQDFNAALKLQPKQASSLYGRGIDELRLRDTGAGQSDLTAAAALQANIADLFTAYGITP